MSFKFNMSALKKLDKDIQQCFEQTAEALHTEVLTAQVMPMDTGTMQNDETFVDYSQSSKGFIEIITTSPQARRLYFHPEYDFQTINNENAKGKWWEDWLPGGVYEDFAQKAFSELLRRKLK